MKKRVLKNLVLFVVLSCLFVTLVAWEGMRRAKVQSDPLSCYELGNVLICVDGKVYDEMKCERLDQNTIFCSPSSGRPI